MYKRTEEAIRRNPPTRGGVMVKCQMGKAIYDDIAFTIITRIDASGNYYVIEEFNMEMNEDIKTDYKCPHVVHEFIMFKGREIKEGDGLYTETTANFFRGGLDGVSRALKAEMHDAGVCVKDGRRYRIRKLTERECFRLMGVEDSDIDKIQAANISKTQQYKMAGNSIVVDVLYHIFRKMFVEKKADGGVQLEMF